VNASTDTTSRRFANLVVLSASPAGIALSWDANQGDATLYGYEVLRSDFGSQPVALVTGNSYTDTAVLENETYTYMVRAVDFSFNRSVNSNAVTATAALRTVTLVFTVTVPATTDGTGKSVYIAGTLNRLDGSLPEWNPSGSLTRWTPPSTITLTVRKQPRSSGGHTWAAGTMSCKTQLWRDLQPPAHLSYGATEHRSSMTCANWQRSPCGIITHW
jgi:hypothetical protein